MINPVGPVPAKIMLIGEAPGEMEEEKGVPFVGRSGMLLNGILEEVGIKRDECYITNVMWTRPPANKFNFFYEKVKGKLQPKPELVEAYDRLRNEIARVQPNVIVPLGNEALKAVSGLKGILEWRGSILETPLGKVIPTIHPASVLRQWSYRPAVVHDFNRIKEQSQFPEVRITPRELIIADEYEKAINILSQLERSEYLAFDIETESNQITCISFSDRLHWAVCIPFWWGGSGSLFSLGEEEKLWERIKGLLESKDVKKIAHNGAYDIGFLQRTYGIRVNNYWLDTMVSAHSLYLELPKGLGYWTSIYTDQPYYKYLGKTDSMGEFFRYNALDSCCTYELAFCLHRDMVSSGVDSFYRNRMHPLIGALLDMESRGVRINYAEMLRQRNRYRKCIKLLNGRLVEEVGHELNVHSHPQMIKWLYEELGYPKLYKLNKVTGVRGLTADDDALARCIKHKPEPALLTVRKIRERSKILSTYLEIKLDEDKRIRCSYNLTGTETGRLSSSATLRGTGCLLPEAEVLTPIGWKCLGELTGEELVLQWDTDFNLSWQGITLYQTTFNGFMEEAHSTLHKNVYTPVHRIPMFANSRNIFSVKGALDAAKMCSWRLPTGGILHKEGWLPLAITEGDVRLAVLTQADGSIEDKCIRVSFKKFRKINRFLELASKWGWEFTEQKSKSGMRRFCVSVASSHNAVWLLNKDGYKVYGDWLLQLSQELRTAFIDELRYWDATVRNKSFWYFTTVRNNAEWTATIAHLTGYKATTQVDYDNNNGYGSGNNKPLYTVNIKPGVWARTGSKHFNKYAYTGKVYCVQTKTGFFLCRYKGQISVTGNTNLQNIPTGVFKRLFIPDEGMVFINADLSQAEARVVAYLANEERLIKVFNSGGDIHRKNAANIFNKEESSATDEERQIAKRVIHASNYGMGPRTFSQTTGIPEPEARRLLNQYFATYPRIKLWHMQLQSQLRKSRQLVNPFGRVRVFFNEWGESVFKEGLAYIPQSTVAEVVNEGLVRLKDRGVEILLQVHDSILVQCKQEDVKRTVDIMRECMSVPVPINGKTLLIPVDFKVGTNWQDLHKYKE